MSNRDATGQTAPIRVLLVDDSPVARMLLSHLLGNDPQLALVGTANDGEAAVDAARLLQPEVIVMDIHMPRLDGFAAARRIMETCPTRIIMVTASTEPTEVASVFSALDAGALTVLAKPAGPGDPYFEANAAEFIQMIKLMSEVPVIRRWPRHSEAATMSGPPGTARPADKVRVVAIGASTGGPLVLRTILSRLPKDFPVPLLIVQHISNGFTDGFAEWLSRSAGFPVRVAQPGEEARAGVAYLAPNSVQMRILANGMIDLVDAPAEHGLLPSVSFLFRWLAADFGPASVGVLLTGMGRDGAQELKSMHDAGALTIAQDAETSIVFGMPGEAIKLGAVDYILAPEAIAAILARLVARQTIGPAGTGSSPAAAPIQIVSRT